MTLLRQSAMAELEKIPEDKIGFYCSDNERH